MSLRVNPDTVPDLVAAIEQAQQNEQTAAQQMATGRSVNNLSDNPAAAAQLVNNDALTGENDQFLTNVTDLQGKFQAADSALNSAVQLMTTAISVGTEGANGTLSAADRQAVAQQVQGIQQQMLALANTEYEGTYIFSGTNVTTPAFAQDSSAASGVQYNGNTDVTSVQISEGQSMQTNVAGSQIFTNANGNVFQALNDLANALTSGNGIDAANTEVQQAFSQLTTQRVFYGNALNQVQTSQSFLNQEQVNLSTQQNQLVGANMTQAITNESQAQTDEEAALSATGQILSLPTLLSYITGTK
ncbi:MAG TPA: flagellar hook-associated protein FlgL [Candidatus Acidoferrales bacterium]|nr:flagellar hook-associated protein FlgL [Candidatus Acidoferrales bacterium]